MQKNSLSLCMIARDEEETIGRAIKSALAIVDEVIVVDTGSIDNTRLIAEGYGARVVDHPWGDDFAAARNAGMATAYGDWILVLDADEVLDPVRPVEVARLLGNEEVMGYFLRVRTEGPGRTHQIHDQLRLFRNHPEARYRYPVHEEIGPSLLELAQRLGADFASSALDITHYVSDDQERRSRAHRNRRLLRGAVAEYPAEPYFHYRLAVEMAVHLEDEVLPVKGFCQMVEELEAAVQLLREVPEEDRAAARYGGDLFSRVGNAYLTQGRPEEALEMIEEGLDRFGDSSLLRFYHGVALVRAGEASDQGREDRWQLAKERLQGMFDDNDELELSPISPSYFHLYPLRYLGRLAMGNACDDEAYDLFRRALELDPSYTTAWCELAELADRMGRPRDALQLYLKSLELDDGEIHAWIGGARILLELGFHDNAASWLQRLEASLPEHPELPAMLEQVAAGGEVVSAR